MINSGCVVKDLRARCPDAEIRTWAPRYKNSAVLSGCHLLAVVDVPGAGKDGAEEQGRGSQPHSVVGVTLVGIHVVDDDPDAHHIEHEEHRPTRPEVARRDEASIRGHEVVAVADPCHAHDEGPQVTHDEKHNKSGVHS